MGEILCASLHHTVAGHKAQGADPKGEAGREGRRESQAEYLAGPCQQRAEEPVHLGHGANLFLHLRRAPGDQRITYRTVP